MLTKISAFYSWANHGWPTIWLQTGAGLLFVFGVGCVFEMGWSDFLFGPLFGLLALIIGDPNLWIAGSVCLILSVLLVLLTLPAQKRWFASFRAERAMLERQAWRK